MSTLYNIYGTDGVLRFSLAPSQRDIETRTDLRFSGMGTTQWGEDVNQNLYNLLENFACPEGSPGFPEDSSALGARNGINNPITGQLWFNTTRNALNVFTGTSWAPLGGATVSSTPPGSPALGALWYDTTVPQLKIWNGTAWISVSERYVLKSGDTMTGDLTIDRGVLPGGHGLTVRSQTPARIKLENTWAIGQSFGAFGAPGVVLYNPDNDPAANGPSGSLPWAHWKVRDGTLFSVDGELLPGDTVPTDVFFQVLQDGIIVAPKSTVLNLTTAPGYSLVTKDYMNSVIATSIAAGGFVPLIGNSTITGNIIVTGTLTSNGVVTGSNVKVGSNNVWHAGNFDPNSKQNVLGYTPINKAGDYMSGSPVVFSSQNTGMANPAGNLSTLEVRGTGGAAFMTFYRPGPPIFAAYLGLDTDNNWKVGGWSTNGGAGTAYKIWHAGNHGHNSGLNADTLDGHHWSEVTAANTNMYHRNLVGGIEVWSVVSLKNSAYPGISSGFVALPFWSDFYVSGPCLVEAINVMSVRAEDTAPTMWFQLLISGPGLGPTVMTNGNDSIEGGTPPGGSISLSFKSVMMGTYQVWAAGTYTVRLYGYNPSNDGYTINGLHSTAGKYMPPLYVRQTVWANYY